MYAIYGLPAAAKTVDKKVVITRPAMIINPINTKPATEKKVVQFAIF